MTLPPVVHLLPETTLTDKQKSRIDDLESNFLSLLSLVIQGQTECSACNKTSALAKLGEVCSARRVN